MRPIPWFLEFTGFKGPNLPNYADEPPEQDLLNPLNP
jgi:hypothetical protein